MKPSVMTRGMAVANSTVIIATPTLYVAALVPHVGDFNRNKCYADAVRMLGNGSLTPDDRVFYRGNNGQPLSDPGNPVVTVAGCRKLCGAHQGWYTDKGPRLVTWLIPPSF